MLIVEEQTDHFMVGQEVEIDGEVGEITAVVEYTVETGNIDRETFKRVIVDVGTHEIDVGSNDVEVLG